MTDWLTVAEAATYAKLCRRTIRKRIHDGDLPACTPRGSRLLRIDRTDLDDMIAGKEPLAVRIRRVLADHGDDLPPLSENQIRHLARLLPAPALNVDDDDVA